LELSRELLARYPKNEFVREQNAGVILRLSGISKAQGDSQSALLIGLEAVRILQNESEGKPTLDRLRLLADAFHDLGGTYSQLGDWANVVHVRRKAMEVNARILKHPDATYDDKLREVFARTRLASVLSRERHFDESAREYETVLRESRKMVEENPRSTGATDNLSNALMFAGISAHVQGKYADAAKYFDEAYAIRTRRLGADPNDWRMRSLAATSLMRLGLAEIGAGRKAPGIQKLRETLRERSDLASIDPDNVGAMAEKGEVYAELGMALGKGAEGDTALRKAFEILGPLRAEGKLNQILLEVVARAEAAGKQSGIF
jgi:tetratricopeptide (TPR) repeat protein